MTEQKRFAGQGKLDGSIKAKRSRAQNQRLDGKTQKRWNAGKKTANVNATLGFAQ